MVARTQLLAAGVSVDEIIGRTRKGALIAVHRGVYRVGHAAPSLEATYMAAVLACGDGALLSGMAAGHLYRLLRGEPAPPEVASPTQHRVPGVATHRAQLHSRDATRYRGIPVMTIPRTLVDLAARLDEDELAWACHQAAVRHGVRPAAIEAVLARRPKANGAGKLRRILIGDIRVTLSALERRFLALLRDSGLPLPETNKVVGSKRVDCRWPEHRLTVELESYRFHNSRYAWEQDHRREREARNRGDDFRRFTYADVVEDPKVVVAELKGALSVLSRSRTP